MKNFMIKHQKTSPALCTHTYGTGIAGQQRSFTKMTSGTNQTSDTGNVSLPAYNEFYLSLDDYVKRAPLFSLLINVITLIKDFFLRKSSDLFDFMLKPLCGM